MNGSIELSRWNFILGSAAVGGVAAVDPAFAAERPDGSVDLTMQKALSKMIEGSS